LHDRAQQYALLGDPTRLTLLTCIAAAGPISVSDLAAATGINDTTVSQTLRYLRASQAVTTERDGRAIHYPLTPTPIPPPLTPLADRVPPGRAGTSPHRPAGAAAGGPPLKNHGPARRAGERQSAMGGGGKTPTPSRMLLAPPYCPATLPMAIQCPRRRSQ